MHIIYTRSYLTFPNIRQHRTVARRVAFQLAGVPALESMLASKDPELLHHLYHNVKLDSRVRCRTGRNRRSQLSFGIGGQLKWFQHTDFPRFCWQFVGHGV